MAQIYRRVNGRPIAKVIALHRDVQDRLEEEAQFRAATAAGLLNHKAKHRTGTSRIVIDEGNVDRYVVLDDTRGLGAALTIEFGRQGEVDPGTGEWHGASEGLFFLHDTFGLSSPRREAARPKHGGDNFRE